MKKNAVLLSLLVLVACAKARQLPEDSLTNMNPVTQPGTQDNKTTETDTQKQTQDFRPYKAGKVIAINSPTEAIISLPNMYARELFESLQLVNFANKDLATKKVVSHTKRGYYVYCLENAVNEKEDPDSLTCSIKVNPQTGLLESQNWDNFSPLLDPSVVPVPATGVVNIDSRFFTLVIKGKDARALYESLNLKPFETKEKGEQINTKGGSPLLMCRERLTEDTESYLCTLTLRLSDGGIPTEKELNASNHYEVIETKPAGGSEAIIPQDAAGGSIPDPDISEGKPHP